MKSKKSISKWADLQWNMKKIYVNWGKSKNSWKNWKNNDFLFFSIFLCIIPTIFTFNIWAEELENNEFSEKLQNKDI